MHPETPAFQGIEVDKVLGLRELLAEAKEAMPWAWVGPSTEGAVVWREATPIALLLMEREEEGGGYVGRAVVSQPRGLPNPALRLRFRENPERGTLILEGEGEDIPELAKRLAQGVAQVLEGRKFWA
jgi:hypothetical protein